MKSTKIVLGIFAGLAIGTAVKVLINNNKKKSKNKKFNNIDDYGDKLKEKFNELIDRFADELKNTRREAEELALQKISKFNGFQKSEKHAG